MLILRSIKAKTLIGILWNSGLINKVDNLLRLSLCSTCFQGQMEHTKTFSQESMLLYGQEIPVEVDHSTVKYGELKPGQASVHHIMTVHASGPNSSKCLKV